MESNRIEFALIDRAQARLDRAVTDAGQAPTFEDAMNALLKGQIGAKGDMAALSAHLQARDAVMKTVISG